MLLGCPISTDVSGPRPNYFPAIFGVANISKDRLDMDRASFNGICT